MLDIAETLDPLLDARARRVEQAELGLEDEDIDEYTAGTTLLLIFFDGEEAFMAWTATDTIYRARSVLPLSSSSSSLNRFSHFSFPHTDTLPKHGRHVPAPTSKAPPHIRLRTFQHPLNNRVPPTSPTRPGSSTNSSAPRRASAT